MRRFCFFITATLLIGMGSLFAVPIQLFNHPYLLSGTAYTSAWDPNTNTDYEIADNFNDVNMPINKVVFYGVTANFEGTLIPSPPDPIEPFFIKFYEFEEGWTEPDPGVLATSTGTYTVRLYDDYGDGWDYASLDVLVNGTLVLDNITLPSGFGPQDFTFPANAGEYVTTVYSGGEYPQENWYQILDPGAAVLRTDGDPVNQIAPTGIGSPSMFVVFPPTWSTPVYSFTLDVSSTYVEPWFGDWIVYRFEALLPSDVIMNEGWVSAQIDAVNGSGIWFLWLNSDIGDDNCFQRLGGSKGNSGLARIVSPNAPKDQISNDLGFELWYDEPNVPVELSSFSAVLSAEESVQLNWVTQSETNVQGYYIYRSNANALEGATLISPLIQAANSSEQHHYTYLDSELFAEGVYFYWLQNVDLNGNTDFHGPVSVNYSASSEEISPEIPAVTELQHVYPNPFNPNAVIPFSVAQTARVEIRIFNTRGQLMRHFDLAERAPGNYQIAWDGKDSAGADCSSGIYYFVMNAGKEIFQRKAVLQK